MRRIILLLMIVTAPACADSLDSLIDDYWSHILAEFPLAAKQAGLNDSNDRFASVTPESLEQRLKKELGFRQRLDAIDRSHLSNEERINAELLEWVLDDSIADYELDLARIPFNTFSGFFMQALNASRGISMRDSRDYEDYIARLSDIPRFFDEHIDNMRRGIEDGFVLPQIVIDGVLPTIEAQVKERVEDSTFYKPFERRSDRLDEREQASLRKRGQKAIMERAVPAFARLAAFLREEYTASETLGAEELPGGEAYYAFQIRRYTTLTDLTSDEIHEIGLAEVRRIREEMQTIVDRLDFDGNLEDFFAFLRTDPRFYAATPDELLKEVAYVAKRIDHRMPGFFNTLPRQSYGVVPVPDEIAPNYTTGSYNQASPGGTRGGEYWVNTYRLDQRPLYEIPALTLHEAVPGHHHQIALSQEIPDVPAFRKQLYFSAFGEGWALYAERLGEEMGIYRNDYERFGRLSYEMWRACRLVVDTGLHAKGWTRERALAFFADNTSLSEANIRAEVDRYISWPAQALSYKLGELKIRELRRDAQVTLGDRFDLREFHDAVLIGGAMPLAMLERQVARYIDAASAN